jgi:diguanylate cyclase (GGDEF)-like protein
MTGPDDKLLDEFGRIAAIRRLDIFDTPEEAVFGHITKLVKISLRVPISAVSLVDDDRQWFKAFEGIEGGETAREGSFCTVAITQRAPLVVPDARADPRFSQSPFVLGSPYVRGYAGAPLVLPDGYQAGALCAVDTAPRTFSAADIDLLVHLATCVVNEIELRQRASRDAMTGFMQRYPFLTRLRAMLDRYVAKRTPAALAILDLDHFKQVNDRYGHDAGDTVIAGVADCCRRVLAGDLQFGRLGGEEFAIAFPGRTAEAAVAELTVLRSALERLTFPGYPGLCVTASFGVSGLHGGIANVSVWCKMADAALYAAKQSGRNTVSVCDDLRAVGPGTHAVALPFFNTVPEPTDFDRFHEMTMVRGAA